MLVDRAFRVLLSLGTAAMSGLVEWVSHQLPEAISGLHEHPDQPQTRAAGVIRKEAPSEQQTVTFGLDGQTYQIDLDPEHAGELRSALQRYIEAGRRIGRQPAAPAGPTGTRPRRVSATVQRNETAAIRAWARAHGHPVSDRGRIPTTVLHAYRAAHRGTAPHEPAFGT